MTNVWRQIWDKQREQQRSLNLDPKCMTDVARENATKDLVLGLYEEVNELSRLVARYKAHILRKPRTDKTNFADEVADVLKYLVSLAQLHGLTESDVYEAFNRKTEIVEDRARGERDVIGGSRGSAVE